MKENATCTQRTTAELYPQRNARRLRDEGHSARSPRAFVYKAAQFPGNSAMGEITRRKKDQVKGHQT